MRRIEAPGTAKEAPFNKGLQPINEEYSCGYGALYRKDAAGRLTGLCHLPLYRSGLNVLTWPSGQLGFISGADLLEKEHGRPFCWLEYDPARNVLLKRKVAAEASQ